MGPSLSPDFNGSTGRLVVDLLRGNNMIMMIQGPRNLPQTS